MPDAIETRLTDLGRSIDWPAADLGGRVVGRIRERETAPRRTWWRPVGARPVRRGLVLAIAALVLLAAAVAAVGIVLPGLRIVFVPPGASMAPASPPAGTTLGQALGLGAAVELDDAQSIVGFVPLLPRAAGLGPPDEVHVALDRLTLLWRSGPALPEMEVRGIGLLLTELPGRVDPGYYEKQLVQGTTTVEPVAVAGRPGYWLSGEPHGLVYRDAAGVFREETRRLVGDVLIWQHGDLTLRLESALGREATIALAESLEATR